MPLPFNKTLDLKLIKLVKENPILYNTKHPKYMDFDSREVIWQKIGDSLGRPGLVCKSRWINMRDQMRRKFKERLKNPTQRVYYYKYEEELSFMTAYFKDIAEPSEEMTEYLEEEADCEVEMPTEVFVNEPFEDTKELNLFNRRPEDNRQYNESVLDLNSADPLDVFLMTIGTTLRKFTPYYLNQAKSKIFQVVQDYELKQIVNKDEQPGNSDSTNR
ncbi:hypothetical protein ABMA27_010794 [Loxostege sticticalis]|uniref:MADF domain-containing protein n=1 Tax=Loxostege sticticalis TaxID=481309 RepID=A0ABR3H4G6_LOXSC